MLCIDQFSANGTLATGGMDRTICLWDTREGTSRAHHYLLALVPNQLPRYRHGDGLKAIMGYARSHANSEEESHED